MKVVSWDGVSCPGGGRDSWESPEVWNNGVIEELKEKECFQENMLEEEAVEQAGASSCIILNYLGTMTNLSESHFPLL